MKGLTGHACEQLAVISGLAEPFADLMGERATEIGMIEDR